MLKVSHSTLIFISGFIWMAVGCFLLPLGLNFIVSSLLKESSGLSHPILNFFSHYTGGMDEAALLLVGIALLVGYLKGKAVFKKSVNRSVNRILALPNPSSLSKLYTPAYYVLLAIMVSLGAVLRYVPVDVRGAVDVAVGTALINGSILYYRQAWAARRKFVGSNL